MKKVFASVLQFVLFLIVFGIFSLFPPFHLRYVLSSSSSGTRMFVTDGLVLTFGLYLAILAIESVRKRLTLAAPATSIAFLLAIFFGLLMKFGFLTQPTP